MLVRCDECAGELRRGGDAAPYIELFITDDSAGSTSVEHFCATSRHCIDRAVQLVRGNVRLGVTARLQVLR